MKLISLPNIASKNWITQQYDSTVGIVNTSMNALSDAALIRLEGSHRGLAITTDCNSRYIHADPRKGAMIAVAEAARNIVCSGGIPVAITNCLNFGNPYNPEVYWQFVNVIQGMGTACKCFDTPVTGGNVSFYNQSADDGPVFPTPVIGMIGIVEEIEHAMTLDFRAPGDLIYLIGESRNDLGCSEYLTNISGVQYSPAPHFELEEELQLQETIKAVIKENLIESAHDVSDGGLFVTLLESVIPEELGFDISTDDHFRRDAFLFGESQSRVVVSVAPEKQDEFISFMIGRSTEFNLLGEVTSSELLVNSDSWGYVKEWKEVYENVIAKEMEQSVEA